jgi:hypothetical protein
MGCRLNNQGLSLYFSPFLRACLIILTVEDKSLRPTKFPSFFRPPLVNITSFISNTHADFAHQMERDAGLNSATELPAKRKAFLAFRHRFGEFPLTIVRQERKPSK